MARYGGEFIPMAILYDNKGISLKDYTLRINEVYREFSEKQLSEEDVWSFVLNEVPFWSCKRLLYDSNKEKGVFNKNIFWHFMNGCEPEIGWFQSNDGFYLDSNSILNLKGNYRYKNGINGANFSEPIRDYVWNSIVLTSEVIRTCSWSRFQRNIPTEYLDVEVADFLIENPDSLARVREGLISLYDCVAGGKENSSWFDLMRERLLRTPRINGVEIEKKKS